MTIEELKVTREYQDLFNFYTDSGFTCKEADIRAIADLRNAGL
jgi:hypothetical protein